MDFAVKRWVSLFAAMISAVIIGVVYSWSVYVNPLVAKYGWSVAETSLPYAINICATALAPLLTDRLRARLNLRLYCLIGAFIYGGGLVLCGFIQGSVLEVYLYFGVLVGGGTGFIYLSVAPYVVRLFPERRGLAAGLFTASYGLGAFFWSPLARAIISRTGEVDRAFIYLGLLFTAVLIVSTRFLYDIPPGWQPQAAGRGGSAGPPPAPDRTPGQVLKSPLYYVTLFMLTCGMISGSMILGLGGPILEDALHYSPEKAAVVVGLFAVSSTAGRLIWGAVSDWIGRSAVTLILGGLTALAMGLLASEPGEGLFLACLLITPMCYGAYASTVGPLAIETFGARYFVVNYNLLFATFGLAALVGPQVIAAVKASSAGYRNAFLCGLAFAGLSFVLAVAFRLMRPAVKRAPGR